ncbi:MAG: ABC transporter ATP-binding protein/permease [marine benthic group bacterium]|nr:ABC transporter ATP-binding protein/permease [Gemmatimonadota bacterium]
MDFPGKHYLVSLFRRRKGLLFRFLATTVATSLLSMAAILLIREFLDGVLGNGGGMAAWVASAFGPTAALWFVATLLIATYVASSLVTFDNQVTQQRIVKVLELGMMEKLIRHILGLSVPFFDRQSHGDIIQAIRTDVSQLRTVVLAMARFVLNTCMVVALFGAALLLSVRLTLWSLVVLPLAVIPIVLTARRILARSFAVRRTGYVLYDVILQLLQGIRVIKVFQGEDAEANAAVEKGRAYFDQLIEMVRVRSLASVYLGSLSGLGIVVVIVVGGFDVMNGRLEWPSLLAFLMALRSIHGPLNQVNATYVTVKNNAAAVQRIGEILEARPEVVDVPGARPLEGKPRTVRFDEVSFSYGDEQVLERVSFEVDAGETIGIVGPSGAGKTTLLNLIARFYDPSSGRVLLDGRDLRDIRLSDLYDRIAVVTQDPFLFSASVADNIAFGRDGASREEIVAAARAAGIDEEIQALPDGYDTLIGIGGHGLSGGQAQRVSIARALLKDAPILLLDEATSSLDSISEVRVQKAIDRLMEGRTTFIVAHRLSTLRNAGKLVVLDAGCVAGVGSHDELLRECPLYVRLCGAQNVAGQSEDTVPPASGRPIPITAVR